MKNTFKDILYNGYQIHIENSNKKNIFAQDATNKPWRLSYRKKGGRPSRTRDHWEYHNEQFYDMTTALTRAKNIVDKLVKE